MKLARKQGIRDQGVWQQAIDTARQTWPDPDLDNLIDATVDEIRRTIRGKRVAFAWSGGKDSLALEHVCQLAGITDCVLAISELEFPAHLQWITDNMPDGLTVLSTGQDLNWLKIRPEMLFPQGDYGPRWFTIVNHRGQERYFNQRKLDILLLGRRKADSNYISNVPGTNIYTNRRGITRYSPIAHWPHEAVFALIQRERMSMPPCYGWPRGYQVGTGSWPARQWTRDQDHGWSEVWEIDPGVVRHASTVLDQARDWMRRTGRT